MLDNEKAEMLKSLVQDFRGERCDSPTFTGTLKELIRGIQDGMLFRGRKEINYWIKYYDTKGSVSSKVTITVKVE